MVFAPSFAGSDAFACLKLGVSTPRFPSCWLQETGVVGVRFHDAPFGDMFGGKPLPGGAPSVHSGLGRV